VERFFGERVEKCRRQLCNRPAFNGVYTSWSLMARENLIKTVCVILGESFTLRRLYGTRELERK
jgi:hypothetical protein